MRSIALFLGAIFVIFGAFAAHGLRPILTSYEYEIFQKANLYLVVHSLAIWILSNDSHLSFIPKSKWIQYLWLFGILFFSGSLYLLTLTKWKFFGMLTPLGGILLITGWLASLYLSILKKK